MAQQVEHILGKDEVTGSNPVISSIKKEKVASGGFFFFYSFITAALTFYAYYCILYFRE